VREGYSCTANRVFFIKGNLCVATNVAFDGKEQYVQFLTFTLRVR